MAFKSDGKPKFQIDQLVKHKLFHYGGIIVGVDPIFKSTDEWYEMMAKSRPPKDKPWYHVQVTGGHGATQTYVTEQNLELNNASNN